MNSSSNNFPQSETLFRIGIILPIDKQKEIELSFSDPNCYIIESENKHFLFSEAAGSFVSSIKDGNFTIKKTSSDFEEHGITVHHVPAGRGFHWKKLINVTLPGNIEIRKSGDSLIVINIISLEQYLACVAVSEMNAKCPSSFLEAQMITARSWVLANRGKKHPKLTIDVCNDDCCQRYQGIAGLSEHAKSASHKSAGKILTVGDSICDARYSKSCGGISEIGSNVWPNEPILEYLESVVDGSPSYCGPDFIPEFKLQRYLGNVDENHSYFKWDYEISQEELIAQVNELYRLNISAVIGLEKERRGPSGRILSCSLVCLDSNNKQQHHILETEYEIRQTLSPTFLYSSAFKMKPNRISNGVPGSFSLKGKGWGHGAGMCQIGALGMTLSGKSSDEILKHYFPRAKLKTL